MPNIHATKRTLHHVKAALLVTLTVGILASTSAIADNCGRVNAYWHTNMKSLLENISECDTFAWQKCSQAAAIHYDLIEGSLGQRAETCGLQTPTVPGWDYTKPQATDTNSCTVAREDLRKTFENRALARLACAAAREGGADQEFLDSQCTLYRSRMANYHLPFRTVVQHCQVDYKERLAAIDLY